MFNDKLRWVGLIIVFILPIVTYFGLFALSMWIAWPVYTQTHGWARLFFAMGLCALPFTISVIIFHILKKKFK